MTCLVWKPCELVWALYCKHQGAIQMSEMRREMDCSGFSRIFLGGGYRRWG